VIASTPTVRISVALDADGLAVVNPCGVPLLPALLSYYLGAEEQGLPPAPVPRRLATISPSVRWVLDENHVGLGKCDEHASAGRQR
jgi:cytochrome c biogenesis protein CcdA